MSDEVQLQGRAFGGKLDWIVGGIYSEDKPYGSGNGSWGQIFAPFYPQPNTFVSAIFGSSSKALFAQGSLDISDWTIAGLKATAGIRYTWDDVSACSLGLSERSEEHTSELQSLMRISYAVFCLKKKKTQQHNPRTHHPDDAP